MSNIVILVNKPCGFELPAVNSTLATERAGLMLLPGQNDVSEEAWEQAKNNPGVKIALKAGLLSRKAGAEKAAPLTLDAKLTIKTAPEIVGRIDDVERLRRLKGDAKAKGVRDIIDERIVAVLKANEEANG